MDFGLLGVFPLKVSTLHLFVKSVTQRHNSLKPETFPSLSSVVSHGQEDGALTQVKNIQDI